MAQFFDEPRGHRGVVDGMGGSGAYSHSGEAHQPEGHYEQKRSAPDGRVNDPAATLPGEPFISIAEAARLVRAAGRKPAVSTVWRWIRRGVGGTRLRAWKFGRRFVTTRAAVLEFGETLANVRLDPHGAERQCAKGVRSATKRAADIDRAQESLVEKGVLKERSAPAAPASPASGKGAQREED